jgi:hypothetical protein
MRATDQYHLGFTMRFPRALSIREDLSVTDCATASGAVICLYGFRALFLTGILAILETVRSEKKRKMENVAEFVFYVLFSLLCECQARIQKKYEETEENSQGNLIPNL